MEEDEPVPFPWEDLLPELKGEVRSRLWYSDALALSLTCKDEVRAFVRAADHPASLAEAVFSTGALVQADALWGNDMRGRTSRECCVPCWHVPWERKKLWCLALEGDHVPLLAWSLRQDRSYGRDNELFKLAIEVGKPEIIGYHKKRGYPMPGDLIFRAIDSGNPTTVSYVLSQLMPDPSTHAALLTVATHGALRTGKMDVLGCCYLYGMRHARIVLTPPYETQFVVQVITWYGKRGYRRIESIGHLLVFELRK